MATRHRARHASSSKLRRDFARCWDFRRRRASVTPEFGLDSCEAALSASLGVVLSFCQKFPQLDEARRPPESQGAAKRHFPFAVMPQLATEPTLSEHVALLLLNLCLAALNTLAMDIRPDSREKLCRSAPTSAQRAAREHVAQSCVRFLHELKQHQGGTFSWHGSFQAFESKAVCKYPPMQADAVDLPTQAGTCDPFALLPADLASDIRSTQAVFPTSAVPDHSYEFTGASRIEYAKLVLRQLRRGKVALRRQRRALGDVFCVAKSTPGRQREVWNGSSISEAARKPPPPEKLANPSCCTDLLFRAEEDVFKSKRDVHTCFDVLRAPAHLQEWFGRPPVTLHELSQIGQASLRSLQQCVVDTDGGTVPLFTPLFPTSTVWPMGLSWSSCVHGCLLSCGRSGGECIFDAGVSPAFGLRGVRCGYG